MEWKGNWDWDSKVCTALEPKFDYQNSIFYFPSTRFIHNPIEIARFFLLLLFNLIYLLFRRLTMCQRKFLNWKRDNWKYTFFYSTRFILFENNNDIPKFTTRFYILPLPFQSWDIDWSFLFMIISIYEMEKGPKSLCSKLTLVCELHWDIWFWRLIFILFHTFLYQKFSLLIKSHFLFTLKECRTRNHRFPNTTSEYRTRIQKPNHKSWSNVIPPSLQNKRTEIDSQQIKSVIYISINTFYWI